jgi:hypothetical protein
VRASPRWRAVERSTAQGLRLALAVALRFGTGLVGLGAGGALGVRPLGRVSFGIHVDPGRPVRASLVPSDPSLLPSGVLPLLHLATLAFPKAIRHEGILREMEANRIGPSNPAERLT